MKRLQLIGAGLVLALTVVSSRPAAAQSDKVSDKVAPQSQPQPKSAPRNLAILIFDGVQIIDYAGPYETFGHTYSNDGPAFNIYTVAEKTGAITTAVGIALTS